MANYVVVQRGSSTYNFTVDGTGAFVVDPCDYPPLWTDTPPALSTLDGTATFCATSENATIVRLESRPYDVASSSGVGTYTDTGIVV